MKKKGLLQIEIKQPSEKLMKAAANDRYIVREGQRQWWSGERYTEKTYGTRLYYTAQREENLLIIAVYLREALAAGVINPSLVTYMDLNEKKWRSRVGGKWSDAYTDTLVFYARDSMSKTAWGIAKDVYEEADLALCNEAIGIQEDSIITCIDRWQKDIREERNKERAAKKKAYWDAQMALIPPLPEDFREWTLKNATAGNNFLFFRRKGTMTEVYCSHCGETYLTDEKMVHASGDPMDYRYKDRERYMCRRCLTRITAKAWGKQKYLRTYNRIVIAQDAGPYIAFRAFNVTKRFERKSEFGCNEEWQCKMSMCEVRRVLADRATFRSVESYEERNGPYMEHSSWAAVKEHGYYGFKTDAYQIGKGVVYTKNLPEILERSGVRPIVANMFINTSEDGESSIQYSLTRAAEHPYIEYLVRSGLTRMAQGIIDYGWNVHNKDANNLKDLLGIDGQQLAMLKKVNGNRYTVAAMQYIKKHNEKLDEDALRFITKRQADIGSLELGRTGMTAQRMINYLRSQAAKEKMSWWDIKQLYSDYLNMAHERGMDLTDEIVCHTPKLRELHDRYVEEKNAEKLQTESVRVNSEYKRIAASYEANKEHFAYEKAGLVIVVPKEAGDIIREGQLQHHCVGSTDNYIKRMDSGETYILFLRHKENTDKPYYTLEVTYAGKILQSYGAYDRKPDIEKVQPVLDGFSRKIAKRIQKAQMAATDAERKEAQKSVLVPAV